MASKETTDDAPLRARKRDTEDGLAYVGRSVLINRPRAEVFAFWRDFQNLPRFMKNVESIQLGSNAQRMVWTIKAPAGQSVDLETEIVDERDGESIAWRSTPESEITTRGQVTFADAPGQRGTVVTADIAYDPPAGAAGRAIAKLFATEPNIQARHELKRFKMLMEAGEIAVGANHTAKEE
jgi:uncharacterized membrane protein